MMWWFLAYLLSMAACLVVVLSLFMINEGDDNCDDWDQQ